MIFDTLIIRACLRIARLINIIIVCCRLGHGEGIQYENPFAGIRAAQVYEKY